MAIFDTFSKRQRRLRETEPDVYNYGEIPSPLRVQLIHVLRDGIGEDNYGETQVSDVYELIDQSLAREYGQFRLGDKRSSKANVEQFLLIETDVEKILDVVELAMRVVNRHIRGNRDYEYRTNKRSKPDDVLEELNARFREHAVGYRFESDEILRVDSEILHQEATKPALKLLAGAAFKGANQEFLEAHEHYRHGRSKECLVSSLKALESTMRVICAKHGWAVEPTANASKLIATLFGNSFLPAHLESQYSSLRSLLESGVPTVRNKLGGHGQGGEVKTVPEFIARYSLNLTASSIVFLVEADRAATA